MPNQPSSLLKFSILAVILVFGAVSAVAQLSTATITGVVQDTSNAVVPGATVTVTQTATNFTTQAVSGNNGVFSIPSLPVGPYTLTVAAQSFAPYEQTGIVLTVGQVADIQVTLKVGTFAEKITVDANASAVESTESTIQNIVEERVVLDLPLNGRNPASLVDTTAGVSNPNQNAGQGQLASLNQVVPAGSNPGSITISTHGVRSGGTYYSLDGASNVDPGPVISGPFPDPDATQEFSVVTGAYGSRYVSAPGGAVNIVTRAGTNAIHGSLFEFIRNGYVNAENALLPKPDTLKRNQYGATIGAPIIKNRWFVFGSYQGSRIKATNVNVYPVPSAAERAGTFTTVTGQPYQFSSLIPDLNAINPFIPWAAIVGPLIVPSTVNANFYNWQGSGSPLIPLANQSNGTLAVGVPSPTDEEQYVIKTELVFGKHRAFARWFSDHFTADPVAEPTSPPYNVFATAGGNQSFWDNYALGDTYVSGNLILETRLSFLNIYNKVASPAGNSQFNLPAMGALNYSEPVGGAGIGIQALGQTVPPGVSGTGKIPRASLDFSEDIIYIKGKHQLAFGGDLRHMYYAQSNPAGQTGVLVYPGAFSDGALPGMLAGIFTAAHIPLNLLPLPTLANPNFVDFYFGHPTVFIQSDGIFNSGTAYMYGLYGEDKYRATQRLTVTAGLRWDPYLPATPKHNQIVCWNPGEQSTVYPNTPEGITFPVLLRIGVSAQTEFLVDGSTG
jgi:Carboxypeptidase regulatory-like domain